MHPILFWGPPLANICACLPDEDLRSLAATSRKMRRMIKKIMSQSRTCRPDGRPPPFRQALIVHPKQSNAAKRIRYKQYSIEKKAARATDAWLLELLCLRMPDDIMENNLLPALIRSFERREVIIETATQRIWLYKDIRQHDFTNEDMSHGATSSITPLLRSVTQSRILAKFIAASKEPSLAAKLRAKQISVRDSLLPAFGKALMSYGNISSPATFPSTRYPQSSLIPLALKDYNNIIGNLELTFAINHTVSKALYYYPTQLHDCQKGAKSILKSFPTLKNLRIKVTEIQKTPVEGPTQFLVQRPSIQKYHLVYVEGAFSQDETIIFEALMQTLAASLVEIGGLRQTSVLAVEKMIGDPTKETLWVNGVLQS
ncbi:uncharacterized protein RCC_08770 [Ramularia collo-cygni]|uniref:F-box domain-containing protein n=1 Tax=Ramularia collo-cygni TaxID=112498 RepID=A0A2D3V822_9PEZI|nr:uncharacterized protein RCC_08770 [Ramularia collo-cygni]CZT23060.1 uncharacterized protein RCC_08770 [Ramularia collo-cygni]